MNEQQPQWGLITATYTSDNITKLPDCGVFVFGSNLNGIHGKGAAKVAAEKFGAKRGKSIGLQGRSYAIPTRGAWSKKTGTFENLTIDQIGEYVFDFLRFAKQHPALVFYVTKIGCGYAGYTPEEIGPLFTNNEIPANVILPREFCHAV